MIRQKLMLLIISAMAISSTNSIAKDKVTTDNVIAKQIGIVPAEIITNADSIVANLTVWESDSFPSKLLSPCMCSIVQYTLSQPVMYSTDKRVYSAFYADVRLVVYKGDTSLTLELDYNINKWRLIDDKGKRICRYDLPNYELLSLIHLLWPESKNINIKYDRYIKEYGNEN